MINIIKTRFQVAHHISSVRELVMVVVMTDCMAVLMEAVFAVVFFVDDKHLFCGMSPLVI
jgi:hypothetical protein